MRVVPPITGTANPRDCRRVSSPLSTVTITYDLRAPAPKHQERVLEQLLYRLFPMGCGVPVQVVAAWLPDEGWQLRPARALLAGGWIEISESIAESCEAAGVPLAAGH